MGSNPVLWVVALVILAIPPAGNSEQKRAFPVQVVVELKKAPSAVAAREASHERRAFDRAGYEAEVRVTQDRFLDRLRAEGIAFRETSTPLQLATGPVQKANRFTFLIDALVLELSPSDVEKVRRMSEVKRVTLDEPLRFLQDNSVSYVRASDGPGNKTIFRQGSGPLTRFDGEGQVIAIFDTGIEHTHPAFDARFSDADFALRTGDARPMRLAGQPYEEGVHHPKVVYFLPLTATTNEDDVGHGTHCASDSAGLKVKGPGLDRIPGNADDQVIEGVAPGALLMAYKVCETSFTCVGTANIVTALEDALSPTDPLGNPKPIATVINMSFGGGTGDPDAPSSVAADNAAELGAVIVVSAGNEGPGERTLGAPGAARRVMAVAASKDPGAFNNEADVLLPNPVRYGAGASTGGQNDAGQPVAPQDVPINAIIMAGAPDVTFPLGQHYVYAGWADTPDQVPVEVNGRIALVERGSTVDLGVSGSGAFAHKVAEATVKGAIAVLIFNNVPGELEATTAGASTVPVYGLSKASGEYLRDALGFQSPLFDPDVPATWGTLSDFPIRVNPGDPLTFEPNTTGFSSRGPIIASRTVKPDVTAPGDFIYGATIAAGGVSTGGGTMSDPARYISVSGTSFAAPHVTGAAALVRQALLEFRGEAPLDALELRSGAAAVLQQDQGLIVTQSLVRAALTNSATNLRLADETTPISAADERTFIHETGSGLIHVVEAVDIRAVMGTNDRNGLSGPDDAADPDFLPTHSFGELAVLATGVQHQVTTVSVTLENVTGASGGGTYSLSLVDGGGLKGDVTLPISGTNGFQLSLGSASVALAASAGSRASFDVTVDVDGRAPPLGLAAGGTDVQGFPATEFLWWVVASGSNGEVLRMPFSYRAVMTLPDPARKAPFLLAIEDGAESAGVDRDGRFELSWSYPAAPAAEPCAFVIERATRLTSLFGDDAQEPLVTGDNTSWTGDDTWVSAAHPDTLTLAYSPLYINDQDISLTSAAPIAVPPGRASLSFNSYEDIEEGFDYGYVFASGNGGAFIPLAVYTGAFSGRRSIDLSGFGGQEVRIRFRFVSDQLLSAPVFQGWFIDDIALETSDFRALGTVDGSTLSFSVTGGRKTYFTGTRTSYFRVGALFEDPCDAVGPYSNVRAITVDPKVEPPH